MAEALGGWSVDGWGFESKKGIGADGDKMKEAEEQMPPNGGAQQPVSGKRHKSFWESSFDLIVGQPDSGSRVKSGDGSTSDTRSLRATINWGTRILGSAHGCIQFSCESNPTFSLADT